MPRVIRFHETGGPEVLRIEDIEFVPPNSREVTIQVKAIGLNRAEAMLQAGHYTEDAIFPARLGYEAAGNVITLVRG